MTNVTIFGTGNMGSAIAGVLAAGGASVDHLGSAETGTITGDVVVLAVPYPALATIVEQYADQLGGKVVVDITNPLDFSTFDALTVPAGSSAAAELQAKLPSSHVLKAFNTNFAATLATGAVGSAPTTVLIAGDDDSAKHAVADLVRGAGLRAADAGSLKRARELEALAFLQMTLAAAGTTSWTSGFALFD